MRSSKSKALDKYEIKKKLKYKNRAIKRKLYQNMKLRKIIKKKKFNKKIH